MCSFIKNKLSGSHKEGRVCVSSKLWQYTGGSWKKIWLEYLEKTELIQETGHM